MVDTLSAAQARRITLAAQGFGRPRPSTVGIRQLDAMVHKLGLLQLDSVNVFERSHYLPLYSRLGAYDKADLDRLTFGKRSKYTEYWAHVAALIPLETWPLWRWRMQKARDDYGANPDSWPNRNRPMMDWLLAELAEKGPLPASKIEHDANRRRGGWWEWSDVKLGLEYLFEQGDVVSAGRTTFERSYALPQQIIPRALLDVEIDRHDATKELLRRAIRAHGVGTAGDLADYYRLKFIGPILEELVDDGEIVPVQVAGWARNGGAAKAYLDPNARIPRRVEATALLSPFDPIVWERSRALRIFDFHYRIEIYTPAPKRTFGYYTLPVLVDDRIVGRIDLKNDRQNRVLRVQSAWREAGQPHGFEGRVAAVLRETASWQGLDGIEVINRGDLADSLAGELGEPLIERNSA
ncbi:MAG TPA: crosslink repair DNA glycosylase YcaQ family protein [Galbitalea sp.]